MSGDRRQEAVDRLTRARSELNADEVEILALIAERLVMGKRLYGHLDIRTDGRDWQAEALDELLDNAVYATIDRLKLMHLRRAVP